MQDPTRSETMEQLLETHEIEQFEIENVTLYLTA